VIAAGSPVLAAAAAAWRFRWTVERDAEVRFARLSDRMERLGAPAALVELARGASRDERRHAELCARIAERHGAVLPSPAPPADPAEIAPRHLGERDALLYEVVAACCVSETESVAVLTVLLEETREAGLREVLRELATDEVRHARLGWAWLAHERSRAPVAFLSPLVPAMLAGSAAPGLFSAASPDPDDDALLGHGVLPRAVQREIFVRTLEEVVFPGLEASGVDAAPGRAWLAAAAAGR
jgi:hypothetical protein